MNLYPFLKKYSSVKKKKKRKKKLQYRKKEERKKKNENLWCSRSYLGRRFLPKK